MLLHPALDPDSSAVAPWPPREASAAVRGHR